MNCISAISNIYSSSTDFFLNREPVRPDKPDVIRGSCKSYCSYLVSQKTFWPSIDTRYLPIKNCLWARDGEDFSTLISSEVKSQETFGLTSPEKLSKRHFVSCRFGRRIAICWLGVLIRKDWTPSEGSYIDIPSFNSLTRVMRSLIDWLTANIGAINSNSSLTSSLTSTPSVSEGPFFSSTTSVCIYASLNSLTTSGSFSYALDKSLIVSIRLLTFRSSDVTYASFSRHESSIFVNSNLCASLLTLSFFWYSCFCVSELVFKP